MEKQLNELSEPYASDIAHHIGLAIMETHNHGHAGYTRTYSEAEHIAKLILDENNLKQSVYLDEVTELDQQIYETYTAGDDGKRWYTSLRPNRDTIVLIFELEAQGNREAELFKAVLNADEYIWDEIKDK